MSVSEMIPDGLLYLLVRLTTTRRMLLRAHLLRSNRAGVMSTGTVTSGLHRHLADLARALGWRLAETMREMHVPLGHDAPLARRRRAVLITPS
ncbi:MAG: hypothetical protein U5L11_02250 [Arhodomonas sp.]|nr:hypothetical protein [Arhodomonas sp.]